MISAVATRYLIDLTPAAERDSRRLPSIARARLDRALSELASLPWPPGVVKLHEGAREYRLKIGEHRLVNQVSDQAHRVRVQAIGARGGVYREIRRRR